MIDKMEKNPHFSPILKWKHPSIWQLFWCDGKLPFDDYEEYQQAKLDFKSWLFHFRFILPKNIICFIKSWTTIKSRNSASWTTRKSRTSGIQNTRKGRTTRKSRTSGSWTTRKSSTSGL